jgi:hypothetical protein
MNTTTFQIPMNKNLHDKAKKVARGQGFSSLQEAVRVFLNQLANKHMEIRFHSSINLSAKNEGRYSRMVAEVQSGKIKTKKFSDSKKFIQHLTQ